MAIRYKTIRTPFLLLIVLSLFGLLGLGGYAAWVMRANALAAKGELTTAVVESALNIVKNLDARVAKGEIDLPTAQARAKDALRSVRYLGDSYLFAYDDEGVRLIQPIKPETEGQKFIDLKDAKGLPYIAEMIRVGKAGGGHLHYYYQKPGTEDILLKMSSVSYYAPWKWMIATGIFVDDVENEFLWNLVDFAVILIGVLAVTSLFVLYLSRTITTPMRELAKATQKIGQGDYAVPVPATDRQDEIGVLAYALESLKASALERRDIEARERENTLARENRAKTVDGLTQKFEGVVRHMLDSIHGATSQLESTAQTMDVNADQTKQQVVTVASATDQASSNVHTVAAAAEELSSSIQDVAKYVAQSTSLSKVAADEAAQSTSTVRELVDSAERIGEVVQLINEISSQTNLLALNATIEAARAGDAGKGFAIVAQEVKNLANQTASATEEIRQQITTVQSRTQDAVDAITGIVRRINEISRISDIIASSVDGQSVATTEIARNAGQAAGGINDVSQAITAVDSAASTTGGAARQVLTASEDLIRQSADLRQEVVNFLNGVRAA